MQNLEELYKKNLKLETRWASPENPKALKGKGGRSNGGRKGCPCLGFMPGDSYVMAEENEGVSGTIRRIWVTISDRTPEVLRSIRLDFYWDRKDKPSFSVPFGDFFGQPLGRAVPFDSALFSNPEGRSFNCFIPMPFRNGMKVVITNESGIPVMLYYDIDYTVGDTHGDDTLYFHAHYRREERTTLAKDYQLLPRIKGAGRFLGVNTGIIVNEKEYNGTWWGEGEVKIYLDGDRDYPTLCGTGTEDYIGTAWDLDKPYSTPYQGSPLVDFENNQFGFYRFHVPDPVFFREDILVTMQQIGFCSFKLRDQLTQGETSIYKAAAGTPEFDLPNLAEVPPYLERVDDMSSCAYFYLDSPASGLPELDSLEKRTARLLKTETITAFSQIPPDMIVEYAGFLKKNLEENS